MPEQREIKIYYDPNLSDKERDDFLREEIGKLENQGYRILIFEPMEKVVPVVVNYGLRVIVLEPEKEEKGEITTDIITKLATHGMTKETSKRIEELAAAYLQQTQIPPDKAVMKIQMLWEKGGVVTQKIWFESKGE